MLAILLMSFAFSYPAPAGASEDLVITNWIVDASLQDTGDLQIVEDITFKFNSGYNGVFREIGLAGTSGISDLQIYEIGDGLESQYRLDTDANKGDSHVYLTVDSSDYKRVQIFSPSEDEEKTFRLSYIVKDVATRYNDTGELYYKFLGNENSTPIDLFTVNMLLPESSLGSQVRVFAYGPQHGEIIVDSAPIYTLRVENVPTHEFIEGRFLFPTDLIANATRRENVDRLDDIIAQEKANQQEQEEARIRRERTGKALEDISLWASIIGTTVFILSLIVIRREKNIRALAEYTGKEIPVECSPAIATKMSGMLADSDTIIATILDLQRRGYLTIEGLPLEEGADFDEELDSEDFKINRLKSDEEGLLDHEKRFMAWLFDEMGNGTGVKTNEVKEFAEKNSTKFYYSLRSWNKRIKADADRMGYFDKSKILYGLILLISSCVLFVLSIVSISYDSLYGLTSIVVSITLFSYSFTLFFRFTDEGYMLNKKLKKFKRYMNDRLNEAHEDHEAVAAFDTALIYALAMGIVNTDEEFITTDYKVPSGQNNWMYWYFAFSGGDSSAFHNSINDSFSRPLSSSDSGFSGGGFSGGGGGGSGGGGAGGF